MSAGRCPGTLTSFGFSCSDAPRRPARENGAQGRDRTTDTVIFSHVLYQLSYLGFRRLAGRLERAARLAATYGGVHPAANVKNGNFPSLALVTP